MTTSSLPAGPLFLVACNASTSAEYQGPAATRRRGAPAATPWCVRVTLQAAASGGPLPRCCTISLVRLRCGTWPLFARRERRGELLGFRRYPCESSSTLRVCDCVSRETVARLRLWPQMPGCRAMRAKFCGTAVHCRFSAVQGLMPDSGSGACGPVGARTEQQRTTCVLVHANRRHI